MATKPKPGAKRSSVPPTGKRKSTAKKKKVERKTFKTPPFVISYPFLFEARENDDGSEKFSACAIFNPATFKDIAKRISSKPDALAAKWTAEWNAIRAEFKRLAVEVWDCSADGNWMAEMRERELRPGLRSGKTRKGQAGYGEGTWFFNMSSSYQPEVVHRLKDEDGEPIVISKENGNTKEIYPGAICRATIVIYDYDVKGGRGITVGLNNVQKLADGPRIDNRAKAADDFDDDEESAFLDDDAEDSNAEDFDDGDAGDDAGDEEFE